MIIISFISDYLFDNSSDEHANTYQRCVKDQPVIELICSNSTWITCNPVNHSIFVIVNNTVTNKRLRLKTMSNIRYVM